MNVWGADKAQTTIAGKQRFLRYLSNGIGKIAVKEIKAADILAIARSMESDGYGESAHRVLITASQVFDHAVVLGLVDYNPAARLSKALKPVQSEHLPAITDPAALGELLRKIEAYTGSPSVKYFLRIVPYMILRSTELREARWDEIDLDAEIWTIPATRAERPQDGGGMKMRKPHTVSLPRQVVALFKSLKTYTGNSPLCFPGEKSAKQCIVGQAPLRALERMGYKGIMCVHGFRASFSTLANERKEEFETEAEIIEKSLAHKERNDVKAVYDRGNRPDQRRELMQRWADFLDELRAQAATGCKVD